MAVLPAQVAAAANCSRAEILAGTCAHASIGNGHVTIGVHKPGNGGSSGGSGGSGGTPAPIELVGPAPSTPYNPRTDPARGCSVIRPCEMWVVDPKKPGKDGDVTISDLKDFPPRAGVDHMEPNGWAVIGLATNFYATVGSELEHGKLLGKRADVRFIPEAWNWSYGDGHSAGFAKPGASWAAQGIQAFDPSPTSHVYAKKGNYTINLVITFSAEYRYAAAPWTVVFGTIDVPAKPLKVTAGTAKTVLVGRDCTQNPRGPGC